MISYTQQLLNFDEQQMTFSLKQVQEVGSAYKTNLISEIKNDNIYTHQILIVYTAVLAYQVYYFDQNLQSITNSAKKLGGL